MRTRLLFVFTLLLLALAPASVLAQDNGGGNSDDLLIRINGTVEIAADEVVGTVFVIGDDVTVAGRVTEALIVIDGSATISGTVAGDVVAISGAVDLLDTGRVTGDLNLYDSDLDRADGSVIGGDTNDRSAFTWSSWDTLAVSAFLWVAVAILSVATAVLFAAAGGRQLVTSARFITERTGGTILAALVGAILIPVVAVLAFLSIFGFAVGLALLLLLMPLMAVLGYIVAGTRLGLALVGRNRPLDEIDHPYLAAVLGVVTLHVVGLVPFLGGVVAFVAAVLGAGALTLLALDAWRGTGTTEEQMVGPVSEQPSPAA